MNHDIENILCCKKEKLKPWMPSSPVTPTLILSSVLTPTLAPQSPHTHTRRLPPGIPDQLSAIAHQERLLLGSVKAHSPVTLYSLSLCRPHPFALLSHRGQIWTQSPLRSTPINPQANWPLRKMLVLLLIYVSFFFSF